MKRALVEKTRRPPHWDNHEDRFWARVKKGDGCWEWTGSTGRRGYGTFMVHGERTRSHRYSWALHFGAIPDGLWVLHRCDNPPCVRPDHLWLGTVLDNNVDSRIKGRHPKRVLTHCKHGHEMTPENTRIEGPRRACRTCGRLKCAAQRRRKAKAALGETNAQAA